MLVRFFARSIILAAMCSCATYSLAQTAAKLAPQPPPTAPPQSVASPAGRGDPASTSPEFKTAEQLLDALEKADENLRSLTSDIQYDKIDGVTGDRQIRWGKVFFKDETKSDASGVAAGKKDRKFSVRFDKLQLGQRVQDEEQLFIFDGSWLIEVNTKQQQIIKRQVMPPGAAFDPLKIGEGPLPLPIGQKKADMLARFKVALLADTADLTGEDAVEQAKLHQHVKGAYQLRLIPNPGTEEAEKFTEIRLWYREGDSEGGKRLLPRMARTVAPKSENVSIVRMINVKTNVQIEPKMMAADQQGPDWNIVIEALPGLPEGPSAVAPKKQ